MRYVIPRGLDGVLSTSVVELHSDDGSVRFVPLVEGNADAAAFEEWKKDGGEPEIAPETPFAADAIKTECGRRIYAVASDNAQKNMLATIIAGGMSDADKATFGTGVRWIAAMQSICRDLISAADADFKQDDKWPAVPPGVVELASRF